MVIYTCSYYTGLSNREGISFLFYIKIITVEIQFYRFVLSFFFCLHTGNTGLTKQNTSKRCFIGPGSSL